MTALEDRKFTVSEFLAWAEERDEGRYELLYGHIVAMARERFGHSRAKFAVTSALREAIRRASVECEAIIDGPAVVVDNETAFLPDSLVNCGPLVPDDQMVAPSPVVVVEVLSPSTKYIDKSIKLLNYFLVPAIHHYLVVYLQRRVVIHHRRTSENTAMTTLLKNGTLELEPPGLILTVSDLFGTAGA